MLKCPHYEFTMEFSSGNGLQARLAAQKATASSWNAGRAGKPAEPQGAAGCCNAELLSAGTSLQLNSWPSLHRT